MLPLTLQRLIDDNSGQHFQVAFTLLLGKIVTLLLFSCWLLIKNCINHIKSVCVCVSMAIAPMVTFALIYFPILFSSRWMSEFLVAADDWHKWSFGREFWLYPHPFIHSDRAAIVLHCCCRINQLTKQHHCHQINIITDRIESRFHFLVVLTRASLKATFCPI